MIAIEHVVVFVWVSFGQGYKNIIIWASHILLDIIGCKVKLQSKKYELYEKLQKESKD